MLQVRQGRPWEQEAAERVGEHPGTQTRAPSPRFLSVRPHQDGGNRAPQPLRALP